jgi:uncharacterized damage-inducible protein DinB
MSDLTRVPRELLAYTIWADRQILECLAGVPAEDLHRETGTSFGTILRTMAHILGAEQIWLGRFLGAPLDPAPTEGDYADLPSLAAAFTDFWPQLEVFLASLTDAQVASDLTWTNSKGETHTRPTLRALVHFANHGTYHRGQVVSLLRQMGHQPPSTDLIYWKRAG